MNIYIKYLFTFNGYSGCRYIGTCANINNYQTSFLHIIIEVYSISGSSTLSVISLNIVSRHYPDTPQ